MSFTNEGERTEDGSKSTNAQYVTASPSGVLSAHVKSLKLDEDHFVVSDPEVYVRIRVGSVAKNTRTVTPQKGRDTTVVDDVKNFSVIVSADRSLSQNDIRIDLIMIVSAHVHRILGHKDMHIYDVIKTLYTAGNHDLQFRHEHVAYVDVEMCFAYGIFGYGYSHELENRQANTTDIVSRSFLYRAEPPPERMQSNSSLVMAPAHIDHPEFIKFAEKVKIGPAFYQEQDTSNVDPFEHLEKVKPVLLLKKMQKRLDRIQSDYTQLSNRAQRKRFLEKLILRKTDDHHTEAGTGDIPGEGDQPGTSSKGPSKGQAPQLSNGDFMTVTQTEDEYDEGEMNVIDMASIIANAPGIIGRGTASSGRRRMANLPVMQEDDSDGSESSLVEPVAAEEPTNDAHGSDEGVRPRAQSTATDRSPSAIFHGLTSRLKSRWRESRPSVGPRTSRGDLGHMKEGDIEEGDDSFRHRPRTSLVDQSGQGNSSPESVGERDIELD